MFYPSSRDLAFQPPRHLNRSATRCNWASLRGVRQQYVAIRPRAVFNQRPVDFHMTPLLDVNDLSRALGRSTHTIKRDLRRNPDAVPPRLCIPGTKLLRWREADVSAWLCALAAQGNRGLGGQP